jgi:uncharacterized protein involved in exopolysaccharide biosynthesis
MADPVSVKPRELYTEEGVDALALLTPLIERRRQILVGVLLIAALVALGAALSPRKYKAELTLTPVTNSRSSSPALSGIAALAGATLQMGYQLTPARMVELLTSRAVLSGVGLSALRPGERVIDRALGNDKRITDAEQIAKYLRKLTAVGSNKETGTISVAVNHRDSALARIIATRIVDSASQIFVRTSRAQAQQLRLAQEARVQNAAAQLATAEDRLRDFSFRNRATPAFSTAGMERERLEREIRFAEQVYTQAMTERDAAFARELEATPTVVVQDPLPLQLPKVRKRIVVKTVLAAIAAFVLLSLYFLVADLMRRRLARRDLETERFQQAVSALPRFMQKRAKSS